ncbi:hypothetical protein [Colwellia sp. C1TZA3]|uniref:hypothetical protein n=1 Tax=Colwellia sp. C1TZA3 TaxID=2508879 RepID=UPI0017493205|nr:hypothetical protein [Colwellia sp. C1TZA3]
MGDVSQLFTKADKKQMDRNIQELACLWVSRIDRGLSKTERQQLMAWCKQNTEHHNVLIEMASYWDDLSVLNKLSYVPVKCY